jgi:hypothetical protein
MAFRSSMIRSLHLTALLACVIAQTLSQALGWRAVAFKTQINNLPDILSACTP